MAQARVAGSKVIQRKLHAHTLQLACNGAREFKVVDERAFGDLNGQLVEWKHALFGGPAYLLRQRRVAQLDGRDIDREFKILVEQRRRRRPVARSFR